MSASNDATSAHHDAPVEASHPRDIWKVITASAVGTMIEWYDFYIFGSLASIMALHFFPQGNATLAMLQTLATFAAGFAVRPFGAIVFGRIGDRVGRKYAFLVTLLIMGFSTFVIGLLPGYATIGVLAPILLLLLRLLQGLALGGEYGGAATYVAEHVPDHRRGYYTGFIQTTATLGLFLSLLVVLAVRASLSTESWEAWGWRIPFLLSAVLVVASVFIRMRLKESPLFTQMKARGRTSDSPVAESFGTSAKWQTILTVIWGAAAGQAVIWYTAQFYALTWMENLGKVGFVETRVVVAVALALATPFFVIFGALSDRVGRKKVMMAGNLIGAVIIIPVFMVMWGATPAGGTYNPLILGAGVFLLVTVTAMVYGPIAAFLVESFPARVRYTSVSVPYHVGNGYFGGFLPFIATAVYAGVQTNPDWAGRAQYAGLIFPVVIALVTFVLGSFLLKETHRNSIADEDHTGVIATGSVPLLILLGGLTVGALVMADQLLLPTLTPADQPPYVQQAFRILVVLVALAVMVFRMRRQRLPEARSSR